MHKIADSRADVQAQIARWLTTVGLDPAYAGRFPHELSGGQRQRVNIARALCVGAEFLVADEPVSALDVSVQAQILNLLQTLQADCGITWVLIGHDLAVMRHMADDLLIMQAGEIVESGPAAQILEAPGIRTPARFWPPPAIWKARRMGCESSPAPVRLGVTMMTMCDIVS